MCIYKKNSKKKETQPTLPKFLQREIGNPGISIFGLFVLLGLMPDNFTHPGESGGTQWVN
jgi:hypothetical protein